MGNIFKAAKIDAIKAKLSEHYQIVSCVELTNGNLFTVLRRAENPSHSFPTCNIWRVDDQDRVVVAHDYDFGTVDISEGADNYWYVTNSSGGMRTDDAFQDFTRCLNCARDAAISLTTGL